MNTLICEGVKDTIFLKEILNSNFDKSPLIIKNNKMDKLQKALLSAEYHYIKKTNYGMIVYGDNGKRNIKEGVIPRVIRDCFGKIGETLKFFVMLDSNGESIEDISTSTFKILKRYLRARGLTGYKMGNPKITIAEIVSEADSSYRILIHIFIIPNSLESQLVDKILRIYRNDISQSRRKRLSQMGPNKALYKLAEIIGEEKEFLIRTSVRDSWFEDDDWFQVLIDNLKNL